MKTMENWINEVSDALGLAPPDGPTAFEKAIKDGTVIITEDGRCLVRMDVPAPTNPRQFVHGSME